MDPTGIHIVGTSMYMIFYPHCIYIYIYIICEYIYYYIYISHSLQLSEINLFRYLFTFVKNLFIKLYYFKNNIIARI